MIETFFGAASSCFCRHQLTFCATSNFLFQHKIAFRATPNFCFGYRLECYVMVIYFYCQVTTRIQSYVEKKKNSFLCDSKNLISFFVPHKFFIFNFTLHMLIFFVVVPEKKNLLIHRLLT